MENSTSMTPEMLAALADPGSVQPSVLAKDVPSWLGAVAKNLRDQPKKIWQLASEYDELNSQYVELKEGIAKIEDGIVYAISREVDSLGKAKYTNETSRNAEYTLRAAGDAGLIELRKSFKHTESQRAAKATSVQLARDEFRGTLSLAALYSAWLGAPDGN